MSYVTFADVVHQSISFSMNEPAEALILRLLDTRWVQRLRDISQTANTRLLYMFSEHSRFGHSLGVAYLAKMLLDKLSEHFPEQVTELKPAILVAALLHDVGHLAPGSHTAFKTWFPGQEDSHESLAVEVINGDSEIREILDGFSVGLRARVIEVLTESKDIAPWAWQLLSGGGWNVDRGNWAVVDSVLAGVSYGKYNIPALVESIVITPDRNLALQENRLDSMMHFAVSRHAMYRQVYQHRVLLAADMLNRAVVQRARDLGAKIPFGDETMQAALQAKEVGEIPLSSLFAMRESWWRYHLSQWAKSSDSTLSDLSDRLLHRRLFKTIRIREKEDERRLHKLCEESAAEYNIDPKYYIHKITASDVHAGDTKQAMLVQLEDGSTVSLSEADPLFRAMATESRLSRRSWFAVPEELKKKIGRVR